MKVEDFRTYAHQIVDWSYDFFKNLRNLPVKSKSQYGDLRIELPLIPPQQGEAFEDIWSDFCTKIVPRVNHWQHPYFFAYFPMNSSFPSLLADMATSVLNTQAMSWEMSPAATELEETVLSWIQQEMRLPVAVRGVIHDTASTSTLCALMAARDRATGYKMWQEGFNVTNKNLILYTSQEAHSSNEKAHLMLGLGLKNIRKISVDAQGSMSVSHLRQSIQEDLSAGNLPYALVGCFGTTGIGAIDPLRELSEIAQEFKLWFHIDAAYGGPTLLLKEFQEKYRVRHWNFDSFVFNPHKWMLTGFDCSVLYVKNSLEYQRTFQMTPAPYLNDGDALDNDMPTQYRNWGPALGRRFRALKLWFVLRSYGMEGIQKYLKSHLKMAQHFASQLKLMDHIQVENTIHFSLVCFRFAPKDNDRSLEDINLFNQRWLQSINGAGLYLSPTVIEGNVFVLRFAVGSTFCEMRDIDHALQVIKNTFLELQSQSK